MVTELRFDPPRRGNRTRELSSIQSVEDLPPYLAEVVEAVANGIQTTREFADRQHISISNASERFRVARELGWIRLSNNDASKRKSYRYAHRIQVNATGALSSLKMLPC